MIAHWDDVEPERADNAVLGFDSFDLGTAAGTVNVGVTRFRVDDGKQSAPVHVELDEEEIFYVVAGKGLSWQDGEAYEVGARDCIVHRVGEEAHTLIGVDGLDVLAFGERTNPTLTWLPRPRVARAGVSFHVPRSEDPWDLEAQEGRLDLPEPSPRRANIVNVDEVSTHEGWTNLGRAAGTARTGLKHVVVPPGQLHCPPHCHSAEEEIFVILEGDGLLELTPSPVLVDDGAVAEEHEVRAGHVVSRPPRTGVAHAFRGGDGGMTLLAYGEKDAADIAYYPRSNKIYFRGVGVIARLDHLAYEVGEESPY